MAKINLQVEMVLHNSESASTHKLVLKMPTHVVTKSYKNSENAKCFSFNVCVCLFYQLQNGKKCSVSFIFFLMIRFRAVS